MKAKNEIILILSSLESTEWLWLNKFLASPYHNNDQRLEQLALLLREAPGHELDEKVVYPVFFPQQDFVARNWGDLLRKFLRVLQAFLLYQQLRKAPSLTALAAVNSRNERALYELTQPAINAYASAIAQQEMPPWEKANEQRRHWQKQYELPGGKADLNYLQNSIEHHRLQHCLLELRYRIEQQISGNSNVSVDHQEEEAALIALAVRRHAEWPLLSLYLEVYQALRTATPNQSALDRCKAIYHQLFPSLHLEDRKFFFTKLIVLFNRNMQAAGTNLREELFELQQFGVAQGIYLKAGKMTEQSFLNICMMGIAVGAFDWVVQFRQQYLPQLSSADITNISILSEAMVEYGRGEYGKVYEIASRATRLPLHHRIRMYGLQLKAHTEIYLSSDSYQHANSILDYLRATDRFLRYHKKVPANTKTSLLNLIKIIRKLVRLKERGERSTTIKKQLEAMVQQLQNIAAREWLKEKIAQL